MIARILFAVGSALLLTTSHAEAQVRFHSGVPGSIFDTGLGNTCLSSDLSALGTVRPGSTPDMVQPGVWTPAGGFEPVGYEFARPNSFFNGAHPRITWVANDGASAVLGRYVDPANPTARPGAVLWTRGGGLTPFGVLPQGSTTFDVSLMSQDHSVAYGFQSAGGVTEFVRWDDVVNVSRTCDAIPGLPCDVFAVGVTPDGSAFIGYDSGQGGVRSVYHYRDGGQVSVVFAGGWANPNLSAISADGSRVAHMVPASSEREVVIWSEGGATASLGLYPSNFGSMSLNASGDALLRHSTAEIWRASTGWTSLQDLFVAEGASTLAYTEASTGRRLSWAGPASPDFTSFAVFHEGGNLIAHLGADRFGTLGEGSCGPSYENSTGRPTGLWLRGSKVAADNDLELVATGLPEGEFGMAFHSSSANFQANVGGSWGHLCLGGSTPIGRLNRGGEISPVDAAETFRLQVDLTDLPLGGGSFAATAGESIGFQVWYRDRNPVSGTPISNLTEAAWVTFE